MRLQKPSQYMTTNHKDQRTINETEEQTELIEHRVGLKQTNKNQD